MTAEQLNRTLFRLSIVNNFGKKWHTASCRISNCNIFRGEQDFIKINNLIVAHWLNILCKRGGVSNGVIAISATLTSRMQLPTCTFIYWNLSTQKSGQRIVSTSIQLIFQYGVLCNRSCIVRSSQTLIIWSAFCQNCCYQISQNTLSAATDQLLKYWPWWLEHRMDMLNVASTGMFSILAAVSYTHLTLPTNREV